MSTWKPHLAAVLLASALFCALGASQAVAQNEAESLSSSFRKVAEKVLPTVVTVARQGTNPGVSGYRAPGNGGVPELEQPPFDPLAPGTRAPAQETGGSGVVIDAEKGLVLTNEHLVQGAAGLTVILADGRHRAVRHILHDPATDLAILTIEPGHLHAAKWGDSSALQIGDWVLALGQPYGLSGTVTAGIIGNMGREVPGASIHQDLLQTDAAINSGNSGGPLVNLKGEVVGINTALKDLSAGSSGLGFAIPSSRARRVAKDLVEYGHARRAYLGVQIHPADSATADALGQPGAVIVSAVSPESPAAQAGLQPEDAIVKMGGRDVTGPGMLRAMIEMAPIGEPLTIGIIRDGEAKTLTAKPEATSGPGSLIRPQLRPASRSPRSAALDLDPFNATEPDLRRVAYDLLPATQAETALVSRERPGPGLPSASAPASPETTTPATPFAAATATPSAKPVAPSETAVASTEKQPSRSGAGPFAPTAASASTERKPTAAEPKATAPEPLPAQRPAQLEARSPGRFPELGLRVDEINPELAKRYSLDPDDVGVVVVGVEPESPADRAGLEVGMLITDISNQRVAGLSELRAALGKNVVAKGVVVYIRKGRQPGFRVLFDPSARDTADSSAESSKKPTITSTPAPAETAGDTKHAPR